MNVYAGTALSLPASRPSESPARRSGCPTSSSTTGDDFHLDHDEHGDGVIHHRDDSLWNDDSDRQTISKRGRGGMILIDIRSMKGVGEG